MPSAIGHEKTQECFRSCSQEDHTKIMKKINICFALISLVLVTTASRAKGDGMPDKMVGSWLSNFFPASIAPGTTASFPHHFLTGDVGVAWKFEHDGTLLAFLPCDVNERFRKGNLALGSWSLDRENNLRIRLRPLDESKTPLEIDGKIEFDSYPSKESGAGTMAVYTSNGKLHWGRYDENAWNCAPPKFE